MNFSPEQAKFLAEFLLPQVEDEAKTTMRVLEAVPDDKADYTPAEKNMKAFELAKHIAGTDVWFLNGIADGKFAETEDDPDVAAIQKPSQLPGYYQAGLQKALARVRALTPEQLAAPVTFYVWTMPNVIYLNFLLKHTVHHRGQLSAYLRPMGAKVPRIYGGSADEPFNMENAAAEAAVNA